MVSVDVYRGVLLNGDIYRNVIEGHTKDYPQYQVGIASIRQWMLLAELSLCNDVVVATDDNGNPKKLAIALPKVAPTKNVGFTRPP